MPSQEVVFTLIEIGMLIHLEIRRIAEDNICLLYTSEKPLPFKPSGGGFGGKGKSGRGNGRRGDQRRDRNRRDDREGGRRDFKRKSNKNSRDFEGKGNKRPHRTSNEKKNGFVIRNKGDK